MYQEFYDNKNDDYINRFKQKVAEQKIATIEERRHELARSRNNFLGTCAGIVLAGVVAWFVLAPQYKQSGKDIPTIHRPQTAVKVKPENPGGMEIPNQDKDVYDIVEKKEVDNTVVENLLPTPEQPKLPDIVPEVAEVDANADNLDEIVEEVAETAEENVPNKPVDLLAEAEENTNVALDQAVEQAKAAEEQAKAVAEKAKAEAKAAEEKAKAEAKAAEEKAKAEAKAAEEKAKAAAENAVKQTAGGKWQVQLVASGNRAAVEKTWADLSGKYAAVLGGLSHEIQTADLGTKGTIYRLRAGSFASREDAQKVCNGLKAKGMNDCIVKER